MSKFTKKNRRMLNKLIIMTICLIFLVGSFFISQPYLFKLAFGKESESIYFLIEDAPVKTQVNSDGYTQVFYSFGDKDFLISSGNYTNTNPSSDGEYVVWMAQIDGYWQIFLHNVVTEKTMQLTQSGNNVNPDVSDGKVVWESQIDGIWQIMLFDGIRIRQITVGDLPSQSARIEGDYISYLRMNALGGDWQTYVYKLDTNRNILLSEQGNSLNLSILDGKVFWEESSGSATRKLSYNVTTDTITDLSSNSDIANSFDEEAFQEFINGQALQDLSQGSFDAPVVAGESDIRIELGIENGNIEGIPGESIID